MAGAIWPQIMTGAVRRQNWCETAPVSFTHVYNEKIYVSTYYMIFLIDLTLKAFVLPTVGHILGVNGYNTNSHQNVMGLMVTTLILTKMLRG